MPISQQNQEIFRDKLDNWISKQSEESDCKADEALYYTLDRLGVSLEEETAPQQWTLVHKEVQNDSIEQAETYLRLSGLIWNHELTHDSHILASEQNIKKVSQSVTITGMGAKSFDTALKNLESIYDFIARTFPEKALHDWKPITFPGYNFMGVKFSNRLFTHRSQVGGHAVLDIPDYMDPNKSLAVKGEAVGLCYTEDSEVQYGAMQKKEGSTRYKTIKPVTFRKGDFVEVIFSVRVIPVGNEKKVMLHTLRGVTLLNSAISKDFMASQETQTVSRGIKRKRVHYMEKEDLDKE